MLAEGALRGGPDCPAARVRRGKADFFHEFVVTCPLPVEETNRRLFDDHGIIGGLDLGSEFAGREKQMLVCCTEMNGRAEIDGLVDGLKEAGNA